MFNVVYLMVCNERNFEDCENSVAKLKAIMFKFFYVWIVVQNSSLFYNFLEFLDLCFSFFPLYGLFCILYMYSDCTPLCFLIRLKYLSIFFLGCSLVDKAVFERLIHFAGCLHIDFT